MILQELPSRGASVELQGDQPAPHSHHQRLRGAGPVAGAQGATTEPVVTALTRLAVAARDLEVVLEVERRELYVVVVVVFTLTQYWEVTPALVKGFVLKFPHFSSMKGPSVVNWTWHAWAAVRIQIR